MKTLARLLPVFAVAYLFAFATPPVYPGAQSVPELNDASQKAGRDTLAYSTPDSFEKVFEFYNGKGAEVPRAHRAGPREKSALFMFKETGYGVMLSWKESSKANGTVIHIGKSLVGR
jgi:hypothetical protein